MFWSRQGSSGSRGWSVVALLCFFLLAGDADHQVASVTGVAAVSVWPAPRSMQVGKEYLSVWPNLHIILDPHIELDTPEFATMLFLRYHRLIFNEKEPPGRSLASRASSTSSRINFLSISVSSPSTKLDDQTDESYRLQIQPNNTVITAANIFGALRGLETFSQLTFYPPELRSHKFVQQADIRDAPRFAHRGFLFDTSRHYLQPAVIKEHIDALSYAKFNVFHWHMTDDHSFPFQSQVFPRLSEVSAYGPQFVYSLETIREIVTFAWERGVRVVPEFDVPGHTISWARAYPELSPLPAAQIPQHGDTSILSCPLHPTRNTTYSFIKQLFKEVASVFTDPLFHIGGDEVPYDCWSTDEITAFMHAHKLGSFRELHGYFERQVISDLTRLHRTPLVWEEVYTNCPDIPASAIVHFWKSNWENKLNSLKGSHRAILSSPWYLNYINYGASWKKYYQQELPIRSLAERAACGASLSITPTRLLACGLLPPLFPNGSGHQRPKMTSMMPPRGWIASAAC